MINMRKILLSIVVVFFISGLFIAVFSSGLVLAESVGDSWNSKSSMPQARGGLGVVVVGDKIYAVGGKTVEGFVGSNERYDPKLDTWVTLESMPTARAYFAIASYQNKIYCVGGLNAAGISSVTEVYDTASGSWSTKASLPVKGKNLQGHVVDGKIFVIEGYNLFMYEPNTDVWTKKTSIPANSLAGSVYVASAVIDSDIVVTSKTKVMIYDANTDTWREGTKPPSEISQGVSGATTGVCAPKRIYTIGAITTKEEWWQHGYNSQGSEREGQISPGYVTSIVPVVMVYDPVKGTWSNVNMGMNRVDFGVAVIDDILYVIGGYMILIGETSVTVDVNEFVAGVTYWGEYRVVSKQFVAPESVVGEPCSWNWQYVPVGYKVTTAGNVVSPSNHSPGESAGVELSLTAPIIAGLVLIVGIATTGLFFYFRKNTLKNGTSA